MSKFFKLVSHYKGEVRIISSADGGYMGVLSAISLLNDYYEKIKLLESELAKEREFTNSVDETDMSERAPDYLWLQEWRHCTKNRARQRIKERNETNQSN